MAENTKSLTLTKSKTADIDGEHRITFVASSPYEDRSYEKVAIETFRLPLKGGGAIIVSELPAEGADNIDIPLILDHELKKVENVIGSVRKAYYVNGELVFEAGISSRPIAQEMFTLIEEEHLDNAFSIQYRDYTHDTATNTDFGGEIIEVSLVVRGCNSEARVLAVKSLENGEEKVEETTETPIVEETVNEEPVVEETAVETETEVKEEVKEVEETEAEAETENVEEKAEETEATENNSETEVETNNNNNSNEEKEMNEEVAKSLVKEATQEAKTVSCDYLKSKSAMVDFARIIKDNGANAEKAWNAHLQAKGLTGNAILPADIENIFFKAWFDNPAVLATFGNVRQNAGAVYAFATEDRALGHKKGEAKDTQDIEIIRRDIKAKVVYKKLPIDFQDLIDDTTGELLRFRVEELAERVANEIVVSAILGDGRSAGTPDYRTFDGTRGLWSMAGDIKAVETDDYAGAVATAIAYDADDTAYDKLVKTISAVEGENKVAVVAKGFIANLLLTKNEQGQYIFTPGTNLEQLLGIRIIELPEMTGADFDVIAYAEGKYVIFGGQEFVRSRFDDTYNQDVMLVERPVAGSMTGAKTCAGYFANGVSA